MSPTFTCWNLFFNVTVFGDGTFGKWFGNEVEPSCVRLVTSLKGPQQENTIYHPGSGLSSYTESISALIMDLQPQTMKNTHLLFVSHPVYSFFVIAAQVDWDRDSFHSCLFLIALQKHFHYHGTNSIPFQRTYIKNHCISTGFLP